MLRPRPWHWLPGRRPALRYAVRSPRIVQRAGPGDALLRRLAEHGIDQRLFEYARELAAEGADHRRVRREDEAEVARRRLDDLGRRSRLPPTAMGRAAGAWRAFGDLALAWRPELDDEARRWLSMAGAVIDPVAAWRRAMGIDEAGQHRSGGLADRLLEAGFVVDALVLPDGIDAPTVVVEQRGAPLVSVEVRRLSVMVAHLRALLGMAEGSTPSSALEQWARLLGRSVRPGTVDPETMAIFAAGRWWSPMDNPPPEALGFAGRSLAGRMDLPSSGPWAGVAARWAIDGEQLDIMLILGASWRAAGCIALSAQRAETWAPWGAQKVRRVRVADADGRLLGEVRRAEKAPSGPDPLLLSLDAADPWDAAGAVVALLHRKVPGAVAARPGAVVWPEGGGLLPIDEQAPALAEARRIAGAEARAEIVGALPKPNMSLQLASAHEHYRRALAQVREEYSADQRGHLAPKSGHGRGRPASGPSVEAVIAARAAAPGRASMRALAEQLGCSRSMVARRLITAADEDRLVAELLVNGGMTAAEAQAAVEAGRADATAAIQTSRSAA